MAADFPTYVDDYIVVAEEAEETFMDRRVEPIWKYLGLQDAPHKRRIAGIYGGPWIGT